MSGRSPTSPLRPYTTLFRSRMNDDVPLLIPEVNPDHTALVERQQWGNGGFIVTNPNCSTVGLVCALRPLVDAFDVRSVQVVDRKSTRLNSSHVKISYAVFCL